MKTGMNDIQFLERENLPRLAYRVQPGKSPALVFCAGFMSDMSGSKAEALAEWCAARGQAFLRFDYGGHGASDGLAADGTIEIWRDDALAVIAAATNGPIVLVGSSMGGWISLLVALGAKTGVHGLVLIAPAPDFTDWGMARKFTPAQLAELNRAGRIAVPSPYGPDPYVYTKALIDSGTCCRLLDRDIPLTLPVRILHGQQDPDVPWQNSLTLAEKLLGSDVQLTLVKDGDHRLSRPRDIVLLCWTVEELLMKISSP
jgi:pimeloyl-ACP methyl ester carboxylesterase